jgi:tRNA (guanine-N7-)-methyltransferase
MAQTQTYGNSQAIKSSQRFVHPRLAERVKKHLASHHQRPLPDHSRKTFDAIASLVARHSGPLILDSFCGTGMSSSTLAGLHPQALVLGVDKSAHRIGKHLAAKLPNYRLIQADCGDFWRLCLEANWPISHHYLLYPNPWPKPGQIQRRIHGSADFTALVQLGGLVELRSNWQTYVEEFGVALNLAGATPMVDLIAPEKPLTLFERKYLQSGHHLWRCRCNLGHNV